MERSSGPGRLRPRVGVRVRPGLEPAAEGLEVAGRLAPRQPPLPLLADRAGEAELEDGVERVVGLREHRAEEPVELVVADRRERQPGVEVDVAGVVDGEGDGVHLQVALEQPAVDARVVLVGVAAHEGVHAERVLADVEPDRRLELLLPRQASARTRPGGPRRSRSVAVEVAADGVGDGGVAHAVISSRIRVRRRAVGVQRALGRPLPGELAGLLAGARRRGGR